MLNHRLWLRCAITDGVSRPGQLSPVLGEDQRKALYRKQLEVQDSKARHRPRRQQVAAALEAIQMGRASLTARACGRFPRPRGTTWPSWILPERCAGNGGPR